MTKIEVRPLGWYKFVVYVLPGDVAKLRRLIKLGYYPNINEAIRFAVRDLIRYHTEMGHLEE